MIDGLFLGGTFMRVFLINILKKVGILKVVMYLLSMILLYLIYYMQPYILTQLIKKMSSNQSIIGLAILLLLTMIIPSIINYISNYFIQSVRKYSKAELWNRVEVGGYTYFVNRKIGSIQSYINELSFTCRKLVQESLQSVIKSFVMIVLYSIILMKANIFLGIYYILIIMGYMSLSIKLSVRNRDNIKISLKETADVNSFFLDFYNNRDTIFSYNSLKHEHSIFNKKLNNEKKIYKILQGRINIFALIQQSFLIFFSLIVILVTFNKSNQFVSLATLFILMYSIMNLTNFGSQYLEIFELIDRTRSGLKKIDYDCKNKKLNEYFVYDPKEKGIRICNLNFKYSNNFIFKNNNFFFGKGKFTALIGSNGSGKSTLLKIIAGLLVPDDGIVIIPNDSKVKMVYLGQESPLFDRPMYDNLTYPNVNVAREYIDSLMFEIGLDNLKYISSKTNGEFKSNLSGGEQQKLLILRTIIQKPDIILFDEITSNLDENSVKIFYKMIKKYIPKATIIGVVHKKNELKYFDSIVKLRR